VSSLESVTRNPHLTVVGLWPGRMFPRSPLPDRCRLPRPSFRSPAVHAVSLPIVRLAYFRFFPRARRAGWHHRRWDLRGKTHCWEGLADRGRGFDSRSVHHSPKANPSRLAFFFAGRRGDAGVREGSCGLRRSDPGFVLSWQSFSPSRRGAHGRSPQAAKSQPLQFMDLRAD
jgi:hypothetical protein